MQLFFWFSVTAINVSFYECGEKQNHKNGTILQKCLSNLFILKIQQISVLNKRSFSKLKKINNYLKILIYDTAAKDKFSLTNKTDFNHKKSENYRVRALNTKKKVIEQFNICLAHSVCGLVS